MKNLPMCRICLVENVRMYVVVNKNLHELYERLTGNPFITEDSRPMLACFFCCTKLKQCCQLQRQCLAAEELFTQMMKEDFELNPFINQDLFGCFNGFTQSPVEHINIVDGCQIESVAIKEELPAVCEKLDDIIEPEEEHYSDELALKNLNNNGSGIEDIPAQQSESDSEDYVPLIRIKAEVEEEQEVSRKTRRVSDTTRAPVVKKPILLLHRIDIEDIITEKLKRTEQFERVTKVVRTTKNSTSKPGHEFEEPSTQRKKSRKKSNTGEKPFKCDICQRCFSKKALLPGHIRTHTGEKPFECKVCQRRFNLKVNLTTHLQTHTGEKLFECNICQHRFSLKRSLTEHIRTHTGEKPFECDICQRCFSYRSVLTGHIRTHTGVKPFKCDVCQRCFSRKAHLTEHVRMHNGKKPFKCDVCQRCFSYKPMLSRHIRTHTGEKPFKCDICERSFARKEHFTRHIYAHTGKKPFECHFCQRCFSHKEYLTSHIRTHTGDKPFKCDICQSCFSKKGHLTRHNRTHAQR